MGTAEDLVASKGERRVGRTGRIPLWVNVMQAILIVIMLGQVYMYFFHHQLITASGITIDGVPMLNLIYEMGARTAVMAFASVYVMITQNPKQYLVVLLMNIFREGMETIIDPLYPILNAPASPVADFWIHIIIVIVEILAFVAVYRIANNGR